MKNEIVILILSIPIFKFITRADLTDEMKITRIEKLINIYVTVC